MNIKNIHDCYGCGLCAIVCPKKIVSITLNCDGFYEPHIIESAACVDCGLCTDVCSFLHYDLSLINTQIKSYAAWSKDLDVRKKCSSGGVGLELGLTLINQGYKVCGVRYNPNSNRAEHYIATTIGELSQSIGSKYIQSYTVDGFLAVNRKEKYLITGTPCQIDSFRRYIQKFRIEENFVLMDFFCHGVPSMLLWNRYIKKYKKKGIASVSWRNKKNGWHQSWVISIKDNNQNIVESSLTKGNLFFKLFLSNCCLGKACYNACKYKYNSSSADIRIGDCWGNTYKDNEDGVSAVVTFTKKGDDILKRCNCELIENPFDIVAEGQMKKSPSSQNILPRYILRYLTNLKLLFLFIRLKNKIQRILWR